MLFLNDIGKFDKEDEFNRAELGHLGACKALVKSLKANEDEPAVLAGIFSAIKSVVLRI